MLRRIISIDEKKCNGCGICATACHEGAIGMVDGKAKLLRDDYCDGLGDCLPMCPTDAISFITKDTLEYNEEEVKKNMAAKKLQESQAFGCPGMKMKTMERDSAKKDDIKTSVEYKKPESMLNQWPVQLKLVPVNAPYFNGAKLLIAADCTAFSYGNFHEEFIKDRVTLIGCPKLDEGSYVEKITQILENNDIKDVLVTRMEVPCCGGLSNAAVEALKNCDKMIPWRVVTITTDGKVLDV